MLFGCFLSCENTCTEVSPHPQRQLPQMIYQVQVQYKQPGFTCDDRAMQTHQCSIINANNEHHLLHYVSSATIQHTTVN